MNKFILSENIKHILNEKYLLDERYILNEASEKWQNVLKNWFDTINQKCEQLIEKLNQIKDANKVSQNSINLEADWKAIKDAAEEVDISRHNPDGQDDELRKDLTTWYQAVKNLVNKRAQYRNNINNDEVAKADDINVERLNNKLNEINKYLTGNFSKTDVLQIYDTIDDSINSAFKNAASTKQKSSSDKVENLNKACETALEKIIVLKSYLALGYNELEDNELKAYQEQLETLASFIDDVLALKSQINFKNYEASFNDYITKINAISDQIDNAGQSEPIKSIIARVDAEKAAELAKAEAAKAEADAEKAAELAKAEAEKAEADAAKAAKDNADKLSNARKNAAAKDWKTLYDNCNTPEEYEAFWKDYYITEWGWKADAVRHFGTAFMDDLKKLGWDSINNPFLTFLKSDEIYNEIGNRFKSEDYVTLHNAGAKNRINDSDLRANEISNFKKSNLIYNLNLYRQSLGNFDLYLKYQNHLATCGSNGTLKPPASQVWLENKEKVLNNLMLASGDLDNFSKDITPGGKLRSLTEISQVLKQITTVDINEKQAATDRDVSQILEKVKDETTAKRLLAYLIEILRVIDQPAVDKANKTIGENDLLYTTYDKTPKITMNQAANFDTNYLNRSSVSYTRPQWIDLLLGLAAKAGIYTTKDKK